MIKEPNTATSPNLSEKKFTPREAQRKFTPSIQINKVQLPSDLKNNCNSLGSSDNGIDSSYSSRSMSLGSSDDSMDSYLLGLSPIPTISLDTEDSLTPFSRSGDQSPQLSNDQSSVSRSSCCDLLDECCSGLEDLTILRQSLEKKKNTDLTQNSKSCVEKLQKHLDSIKSENSTLLKPKSQVLKSSSSLEIFSSEADQHLDGKDIENIKREVENWISRIVKQGFGLDAYAKCSAPVKTFEEVEDDESETDDTWFETGLLRVFDPYVDVRDHEIEEVEGRTNSKGCPTGKCNVKLVNGDSLFGKFQMGIRQGRGAISGDNLFSYGIVGIKGYYKDGILEGEGRAILAPGALAGSERVTLEGFFVNGYMEGPVRGLDEKGNVVFIGAFEEGIAKGPCWLSKEGQGWIHGIVDKQGKFSGNEICYLYPDLHSCIFGQFQEGQLVAGRPSLIVGFEINENQILHLKCSKNNLYSPVFSYSPSTKNSIPCNWLDSDHYESSNVTCDDSKIDGAGDGLFAKKDLPMNQIVSYYNGYYINHGEIYNSSNCNYQIYIDWRNTEKSPFVDVPEECTKIENYRATLGHKANHSFIPNCQFVVTDHPRFGKIPSLKTLKPISKGEELFCHYKYDFSCAPQWYLDAWATLNNAETQS